MKVLPAILSTMFAAQFAFADADFDPDKYKASATATRETGGTGSSQATINQGSNTGEQSQKGGAGANAAAGAALMAAGAALMANPPTAAQGAMLMAMGIMAMMQSGEDSGAAGKSANTGVASLQGNPNAADATGDSAFANAKIAEGKTALASQGYSMDSKGNLHNPDGSVTSANSFNSAAGMSAAGMTPQTIAEAQKILDESQAGVKVTSVGVNSGGGGSNGVAEGDGGGEAAPTGGLAHNPFNLNADAKAKLMAGKTVMFDGEPIGVRGQNIFEMVHTCYQKKRQGNHFIEAEQDVAVRMPASATSLKPPVRRRNN